MITILRILMEIHHVKEILDAGESTGIPSPNKQLLSIPNALLWVVYAVISEENLFILSCELAHLFMEVGVLLAITKVNVNVQHEINPDIASSILSIVAVVLAALVVPLMAAVNLSALMVPALNPLLAAISSFSRFMPGVEFFGFIAFLTSILLHVWPDLRIRMMWEEVPALDRISQMDSAISLASCFLWITYGILERDVYISLANFVGAVIAGVELLVSFFRGGAAR